MALSGPFISTPVVDATGKNNSAWSGWFNDLFNLITSLKTQSDKTIYGTGSPEGVVTAEKGTLYINTLGGANFTLWVKELGSSNVGWKAK